jgi:methylated-DNA-[protein]-cysteine S-methyltransferase
MTSNDIRYVIHASPIGPLRLAATARGLSAIYMDAHRHAPDDVAPNWRALGVEDAAQARILDATRTQLDEYFAGERTVFDVPLDVEGTTFQRQVWHALCDIAYGETISYGELARRIGSPKAVRAVGLANGRNPVSIVVPCHRVIGADGSMTGYGGGIERKVFLLGHEGRIVGNSTGSTVPQQLALV